MYETDLWRDITTSIHHALSARLDLFTEDSLVRRSDTLLARLPSVNGSGLTTTAMLLGRYHTVLHKEVCRAHQPRTLGGTVEDDLRELTRAMLVTVGIGEGISVEAAVGMALVLYKRGVAPFCALPIPRASAA